MIKEIKFEPQLLLCRRKIIYTYREIVAKISDYQRLLDVVSMLADCKLVVLGLVQGFRSGSLSISEGLESI